MSGAEGRVLFPTRRSKYCSIFVHPAFASQVFEDLYRETHGLPRRKPEPANGVSDKGSPGPNEFPTAGVEAVMEAAAAEVDVATPRSREEEEATRDPQDDGDDLAADPEVARLLDELQDELDAGCCSDGSDSEEGGEEGVEGEDGEEERKSEQEDENEDEKDDGARNIEAVEEKTATESKDPPPSPRRKEAPQPGRASTGTSASPPPRAERCHQGGRGGIDISRMKIDAPHHTHWRRGGARPRSAPSACLSVGGFSKLSSPASSSSRIARTVSQKLLQATREAEEQRAAEVSEAQGGRRSAAASVIAQADGRIDVVKQNAEALQVRHAPRDACMFRVVLYSSFSQEFKS